MFPRRSIDSIEAGQPLHGVGTFAVLMSDPPRILVVSKRLPPSELAKLIGRPFPDMVKFVVDVDRKIIAVGGELHADAEAILLDQGSQQEFLWGGNYYTGVDEKQCIEYTSLINIRPSQSNLGMLVQDPDVRNRMRSLVFALVGRGEALP